LIRLLSSLNFTTALLTSTGSQFPPYTSIRDCCALTKAVHLALGELEPLAEDHKIHLGLSGKYLYTLQQVIMLGSRVSRDTALVTV
jgi:hypothetical protein